MVQYGWSFWTLPKHNQKRLLEDELRTFLHEHENLSPCERYLLAETIVHVYAGRYGQGRESMDDVHESPAPSVGKSPSTVVALAGSSSYQMFPSALTETRVDPALAPKSEPSVLPPPVKFPFVMTKPAFPKMIK